MDIIVDGRDAARCHNRLIGFWTFVYWQRVAAEGRMFCGHQHMAYNAAWSLQSAVFGSEWSALLPAASQRRITMGLFSFVKHAGEVLANAAHLGAPEAPAALQAAVEKHNLGVQNMGVQIDGDKVSLTGSAPSAEAAEKAVLAAGNIQGIASVESKIAVPPAEAAAPASQFYTVVSGDTLSKISKQVYGDANRYNEIFAANRPLLSSPDKIYPGQSLRIPQGAAKSAAA
jgi:nucleoid-associated protein YgaU